MAPIFHNGDKALFYAPTLKELDKVTAEYKRQMEHGFLPTDENATFGELAAVLCKDFKPSVSEGVRKRYEQITTKQLAELSSIKVRDLKTSHLQVILNKYAADGLSSKTLNGYKQVACQVLNLAVDNDIVARNVFERVTIAETAAEVRKPITKRQRELLESTYQEHRMGIPAMIMLYAGLRRGELLALTWRDIDLNKGVIHVNKALAYNGVNVGTQKAPKTAAGVRDVPVFDPLMDALTNSNKRSKEFLVCPSSDGKQMTNTAFLRAWQSYMHYLNIAAGGRDKKRGKNDENGKHTYIPAVLAMEPFTAHQLRHSFVTLCHEYGIDAKVTQTWAGHSNIGITLAIYTHLTEAKEAEAIAAFNARTKADDDSLKNDGVKMG